MNSLQTENVKDYTIISLDINNLKQTNDALGHSAGDLLIRRAAQMLKESFDTRGIIGRMGGDEFIVIIPSSDKNLVEQLINQFKQLILRENSLNQKEKLKNHKN